MTEKGYFPKGHIPWNKGVPFNAGGDSVTTRFQKGNLPHQTNPEGTVTKVRTGDSVYNFININSLTYERKLHKYYARFVVEEHLGRRLTPQEIVWHIDGDSANDDINNLEVITRAEMARRNVLKRHM